MRYRIIIAALWLIAGVAAICRALDVTGPAWDALGVVAIAAAVLATLAGLAHRAGVPLWWAWEVGYRDGLAQLPRHPSLRLVNSSTTRRQDSGAMSEPPTRPPTRRRSRILAFPEGTTDRKAVIAKACNADLRKTDTRAADTAQQLHVRGL